LIIRLLNDVVPNAEVIYRIIWENDYEGRSDTNLEGKDSGIFQGTIPALAWKNKEESHENPQSR
jgi:hypothetical protein